MVSVRAAPATVGASGMTVLDGSALSLVALVVARVVCAEEPAIVADVSKGVGVGVAEALDVLIDVVSEASRVSEDAIEDSGASGVDEVDVPDSSGV